MVNRVLLSALLTAVLATTAWAQDESEPSATGAEEEGGAVTGAPATSQVAAPVSPRVSVEEAYRREFAFLAAERDDLQRRLNQIQQANQASVARVENEIANLENAVLSATTRADRLQEAVVAAEQATIANEDIAGALDATFLQAEITLIEELDVDPSQLLAEDDVGQVNQLFDIALAEIQALSTIRRSTGSFFLTDGTEVEGDIVRVGNVAAYGVSGEGSGTLAPAGGGRLRIWDEPASDSAQAFAGGNTPQTANIFLFESTTNAIETKADKTVIGTIKDGGVIGWVIVALGSFGLLLIILRAIFLQRASSSVEKITDEVGGLVRSGKLDAAIAACKKHGGSAGRVVAAAVRNLDRDREHLEDIVSEAILHESGHLNRFGQIILVIAAVSPLLGLLGTVTGMISTFDVITEFGTGDPKLLAGGIAIALVTTELGLIVAIPTLLVGNMLSGWAERIKDDMEKAALRVINTYHGKPAPATTV